MLKRRKVPLLERLLHRTLVGAGALALTALSFLVLPVIQAMTERAEDDMVQRVASTVALPTPDDFIEPEELEEEPVEEEPPELEPEMDLLDLSELELALHPGLTDGLGGSDFTIELKSLGAAAGDVDELFGMDELDSPAKGVHTPLPVLSSKLRSLGGGTVYVLLVIDERGRVEDAQIQSSPHPDYEAPTLAAVRKWRFEPGKRNGQPVRSRRRAPIKFPES